MNYEIVHKNNKADKFNILRKWSNDAGIVNVEYCLYDTCANMVGHNLPSFNPGAFPARSNISPLDFYNR